jgi:hypothetical protein
MQDMPSNGTFWFSNTQIYRERSYAEIVLFSNRNSSIHELLVKVPDEIEVDHNCVESEIRTDEDCQETKALGVTRIFTNNSPMLCFRFEYDPEQVAERPKISCPWELKFHVDPDNEWDLDGIEVSFP